jgi:hypothetical protein
MWVSEKPHDPSGCKHKPINCLLSGIPAQDEARGAQMSQQFFSAS